MAIGWARRAGVGSLLDLSEPQWRELARSARRVLAAGSAMRASSEAFLIHARDAVESLRDGVGWEAGYPRDVWRLSRLPGRTLNSGRMATRGCLRFDQVSQPWLKDLGKRRLRLRLCSGLSAATAVAGVRALTHFSEFLAVAAPGVDLGGMWSATWRGWRAGRAVPLPGDAGSAGSASSSRRSAVTAGMTLCRRPRACSPVTARPARRG
jgi:hypothetical protein